MSDPNEYYSEEAVRRRVNRNFMLYGSIVAHFIIWVMGVAVLDTLGLYADLIAPLWFGLVMIHAATIGLLQIRSRMMDAALEQAYRHRIELGLDEKAKRKHDDYSRDRLVLSEDGEVLDVVEDNWADTDRKPLEDSA